MKVALIVAMGENREIGKDNDLLWHIPRDMRFFKETTQGHIVVMGRKNWDSIPLKYRPLSDRRNIVLTRNANFSAEGAEVFYQLDDVFSKLSQEENTPICFIIGGAQVYDIALQSGKVEEMYISHVQASFDADTFFPDVDLTEWNQEVVLEQEKDEKNPFAFVVKRYWR